jgi:hypothetical protein
MFEYVARARGSLDAAKIPGAKSSLEISGQVASHKSTPPRTKRVQNYNIKTQNTTGTILLFRE